MNAAKIRGLFAIWIFLTALVCLLGSANLIRELLAAYPASHIASYGPRVPEVARLYAAWLPYAPAPAALLAAALVSVAVWFLHRRSDASQEAKTFAMALIAALDLFLAFFCTGTLLIAYFYLPKIANGA